MAADDELYPCPLCPKRYKRKEHMQRHLSSHGPSKPYSCAQCSRGFQRLDVLKRHARMCEARAKGWIAPTGRRRACDLCVRQKKACSTGQPCDNCERTAVACLYSFATDSEPRGDSTSQASTLSAEPDLGEDQIIQDTRAVCDDTTAMDDFSCAMIGDPVGVHLLGPAGASASWPDFLHILQGGSFAEDFAIPGGPQQAEPSGHRDGARRYTFMFLENFTRRTGLLESFECGSPALRMETVSHFFQEQGDPPPIPGLPEAVLTRSSDGLTAGSAPSTGVPNAWLRDPLMIKVHQIIVLVKEVVTVKPRNSVVTLDWSTSLEQRCLEFFSPMNLRKFLALYWAIWHPNVNLVHRPTFDPATASPTLLATMAVMGACMSPSPEDRNDAKLWFNCVEEMVFTDDDLCSEPLYTTMGSGIWIPAIQKSKVQALQAAYIVCLYQNWEGTDASKRRIRRYRFGTVISASRDIGLSSAVHTDAERPVGYDFEWKAFALKEELIRIFLWIFLMDHAFVTFNNLPPRMVIKEMNMHMARPEGCFQAASGEECLEQLRAWNEHSPVPATLMFHEAVEMICRGGMSEDMHRAMANLGPLNLFAIISAVHSLVFQHQNSIGECRDLTAIRHALDNWKPVWDYYSSTLSSAPPHSMVLGDILTPDNAWRRIGFCRHAHEYWLLANVIIDRMENRDSPGADPSQTQQRLLGVSPEGAAPDPILTRYDQTSMRQVNDLIADFQKVQIHGSGMDGL